VGWWEGRGGGEDWRLLQHQWEGVRGVKCQEEGGTEASKGWGGLGWSDRPGQ
jgi:hypothetical protein